MPIRDLRQEKNRLRNQYKSIRKSYDPYYKSTMDKYIFRRITGLYQYKSAEVILTYVSKELETALDGVTELVFDLTLLEYIS